MVISACRTDAIGVLGQEEHPIALVAETPVVLLGPNRGHTVLQVEVVPLSFWHVATPSAWTNTFRLVTIKEEPLAIATSAPSPKTVRSGDSVG
jgi:hypothetical protein